MVPADCTYQKGSLLLKGTPLYYGSSPANGVRDAIKLLKARQPNTRVLLQVGGELERAFAALNTQCIKDLVDDLGCDGIVAGKYSLAPNCRALDGKVTCDTDEQIVRVATKLREAMPKGAYLIGWSAAGAGAFGEGEFAASQPASNNTGVDLAVARSPAGQSLDLVSVGGLGTRVGLDVDRTESMRAHHALWPQETPLLLGASKSSVNHNSIDGLALAKVDEYAAAVAAQRFSGLDIHGLDTPESDKYRPSQQEVFARACTSLGMAGCAEPLPKFHSWKE
jgi:hypothetical protein